MVVTPAEVSVTPTAPGSIIPMPTKTPISALQEFCAQRGMTPTYDLIANEGAVHEPVFVYRVVVGEIVAQGKGPSKKKAKHAAAQEALERIRQVVASAAGGQDMAVTEIFAKACKIEVPSTGLVTDPDDDDVPGNPVGGLQEFTQKKLLRPPIYEFISEQGPPHCREFVCIVHLGKLQDTGVGKSKKNAKRAAAYNMLKKLEMEAAKLEDGDAIGEEVDAEQIKTSYYSIMKEEKKKEAASQLTQISGGDLALQGLMGPTPGSAAIANKAKLAKGKKSSSAVTNFIQVLQTVAEAHGFEVTYVDLPEMSTCGRHQCIVQLSTMPVAVCHGLGATKDLAHMQAAQNAVSYLKTLCAVNSGA